MQQATSGISEKTALWFSLAAFGVITIVSAILTPSIVQRFYPLLPDAGADWYYWQLPQTTTITRITYWVGYGLHQLVVWVLLVAARGVHAKAGKVTRFNLAVLGVNLLFVALHQVQTYFWYDGLAQDVPIWVSQGSVIVMLVLILFLELPRRGLFWGKAITPPKLVYRFVQRWHGIFIAWAIVFTFWFHPMDGNWGLLSGFIYMFLLFIQLSMFGTRLHMNRGWVVLMEAFVVVHATLITVYKDNPIWTMFMVGFLWMFVLTQVHAFRLPTWAKWTQLGAFVAGVALLYAFVRGFNYIYEIVFIPVALYGGALGLLLVGLVIDRIGRVPRTAIEAG